jgi:hypothetical protein
MLIGQQSSKKLFMPPLHIILPVSSCTACLFHMGRKRDIPPTTVAQICALRGYGLTERNIASELGISHSSVHKCLVRCKENETFSARKRPARKRVTSIQTDRAIRRIAIASPTASATYIASQLPPADRSSVHTSRRRLQKDFNLKAYRPAYKPLLSSKNIHDRLLFCQSHRMWTAEDWSSVLFSDESLIRQFNRYAPYVRRPPNQRYNRRYTIPIVKHSPSIMIWGAISACGASELWTVPPRQTVNSDTYMQILEERLQNSMETLQCSIYQQDGAPCHT